MQDDTALSESDEGKEVVNANGESIGRVVDVQHGTAHVDPDPGLTDSIMSKLGWAESDEETYQLDSSAVESVTDDEIRISP